MSRKPKTPVGRNLLKLVEAITGVTDTSHEYVGKKCYGRAGTDCEGTAGEITNVSHCHLSGCSGTRLHVKWPDGKRTYPCAKGCKVRDDGNMEIL